MPYRDMRDYLAALEQQNLLKRVTRAVDHNWEVACLAKWMYQALPVDDRFGFYFQNVKGTKIPVVTGALGASPKSVALELQCEVNQGCRCSAPSAQAEACQQRGLPGCRLNRTTGEAR